MENGGRIFSEDEHGRLVPMRVAVPPTEDELQDLIARFPDIVTEDDGQLLLISREQGVPGEQSGSDRWSLDHLFINQKAVPVLIEVKRASDTRIRREVVGQILDYAANGVSYWPSGALEAAFVRSSEEMGEDPQTKLAEFLGEEDPADFWAQAESNLDAGRLKLIVAADRVPAELARVIEFMNEQMRAEVRAVELRYFQSEDGRRTLAPRVIGETERTRATKSTSTRVRPDPISVAEWFDRHIAPLGDDVAAGARCHMEMIERLGGEIIVASTQGSLPARFLGEDGRNVYPLHLQQNGRIAVSFGWTCERPQLADEQKRREIFERFFSALGGLSTRNLQGSPTFPAVLLLEEETRQAYETVAQEYIRLAMAGPRPG